MSIKKSNGIEEIKLFIAELMNEEQASHSKLVNDLRSRIGDTREFDDTLKVLTQIYNAKSKLLEKIYQEMQGL
jgi:hypothetical protein